MVALFGVAVLLSGCGCTTVGCGDDLRLDAAPLPAWVGSDSFTVEVWVDGACDVPLEVSDASASEGFGFPLPEGASGTVVVDVTVRSATAVRHASGSVMLREYRPNGRFCAPTCSGADIAIDDDVVRNR